MSKDPICHSGPFDGLFRDCIRGMDTLEECFGSDLGDKDFEEEF